MALVACCASLRPSYTIVVRNSTGQAIDDATVSWQGFTSVAGGSMFAGVWSSDNFIRVPLPPRASVSWRTRQDGKSFRKEVEIPEGLPRNFKGKLTFELFQDGRVDVRAER